MKRYFPVLQYVNIPNLTTTLGLVFGIAACYYLVLGNLRGTLICLFFSTLMDLIDGFLAVKLKRTTNFGQHMDSLVDFFICCIMPILMVYTFVGSGPLLVAALAFYSICALWRLAYFNSVTAQEERPGFSGLPVPGAMLIVIITIWLVVNHGFPIWLCAVAFFLTGLLMVSSIKMKKYGACQKALWVMWLVFLAVILIS